MSTSAVEVSGEKVKAMWDKRLTEIFCDICIKEILKGNRPGTHFTKDGWLKIMNNFEKETGKAFSQRQLKNRWDALKKEWKAWKKLKGEDTSLGWNPIKRTVDASDDWWERIVATGDKAWAPSSGTLCSDFLEDVNNKIPKENGEENVMSIVENSSGDESDDEREKKEILQRMECFNRLFVVASSSVQLYYEKYILKQPCMDSKQTGERWIREILDGHESRCMINFRMSKMDCIAAIDGTHIAAILPPNEQIPYIGRKCIPTQNVMAVCDFNMCFTFVMAGWEGSTQDSRIFLDAIRDPKYKFPHPPNGKYYLVDSGYRQMKCYLRPYRGHRYHLPDFRRGRPVSENAHGQESDDDDDDDDDGDDDGNRAACLLLCFDNNTSGQP
ncbi:hypothetical protein CXB51_034198 [Gossypium anomalum]|uniref:Myb/SANT-like domain-containing protein n=1 Tax=Gossypium anomalum TaxID=47600 RepID=A0A8J6CET7_9ROSI|nr:hypothetical protein CXB51_034198 [Gossypium anomalum]